MRFYIFTFIAVTLFSCGNEENKQALYEHPFGKKFNPSRQQTGLPLLEDGWLRKESVDQVFEDDSTTNDVIFWVPDFVDMNKPYHKYKKVEFSADTIIAEEDVYYFYPTKEKVEVLKVGYDFTTDSLPWTTIFITYNKSWSSDTISKQKANNLLKSWELK